MIALLEGLAERAADVPGTTIITITLSTVGVRIHGIRATLPRNPMDMPRCKSAWEVVAWDRVTVDGITPLDAALDLVKRQLRSRKP